MTGSLQEKRGIYQCVLSYKDKEGKRKQKWISTNLPVKGNKRKAEKMLNDLISQYSEAELSPKNRDVKFTDYLKIWLERKKDKVEKTTWDGYYNSTIKHLIPYFEPLNLKIKDLKPKHIVDYYNYKFSHGRRDGKAGGLSNKSIKEHSIVIKNALNSALIEELIDKNPAAHVPLPKRNEEQNRIFLNVDQSNQLLKMFHGHRLQSLIYVTLYYGLRRSEVLGLRWNAIDFQKNEISICHTVVRNLTVVSKDKTKSKAGKRKFELLPEVKEVLLKVRSDQQKNKKLLGDEYIKSDYIFTWENGKPYDPNYVTKAFQKHLQKNHFIKMRFHDLRHSCASILYDKGWSLKDIQEWLGHADIETTGDIYTHITQDRRKNLASDMSNTFHL